MLIEKVIMSSFSNEVLLTLEETRKLMQDLIELIYKNLDKIQSTRYEITLKPDGSPVTASDLFIEKLIQAHLTNKIPNITFVGEESFTDNSGVLHEGYYALLDPIDGTENFCSGLKEWGVSFTLWYGSIHLGSLLFLPELGEHLMTGDKIIPIKSRIRGFSSSICPEIIDGIAETRESRLMGCAVYNLYNVIRGSFNRFTNPLGAYSWDLLPGLMLALEHDCKITLEGKKYNGEFLAAGKKYRIDIQH